MMQFIAINVAFYSFDGSRRSKVLTSLSGKDTIGHFVRNIKKEFELKEEVDVVAKLKLTFMENKGVGKWQH